MRQCQIPRASGPKVETLQFLTRFGYFAAILARFSELLISQAIEIIISERRGDQFPMAEQIFLALATARKFQ